LRLAHLIRYSQGKIYPEGYLGTRVVLEMDLDAFAAAHVGGATVTGVRVAVAGLPQAHRTPAGAAA
jgi:hypothetical protein